VEQYFRPPAAPARKHVLIAGSVSWGGANAVPALTQYMNRMYAAGYEPKVLVGADAYLAADDFVFVDALRAASGERFELLHTTSPLQWLAAIADAALLVSGRFHHTIAAAFVDTPFIVMESNTPKIAGIMQMLQSQSFVSVREPNLADVLFERSQRYIADAADGGVHEDVKAQLRELARQNFRGPLGARDT
jgi:polysaccharide pyruvyl transferase WcaK-like protein